ncbi:thiamine biosynthesis protein ApbE [Tenacibaculum sp. Bg11-29]|uniref:FAD:protein FMN transferase n=1 Tax=Tenacibaculum sp. Bg11-29 TaxID=2058306 RepID=UPI000C31F56E|nr:FAD:protein FMN transferase [Tenacibaculum sp. Bg11-29]PKH49449.1 thiamine biosynthesis protein ApbE [Tenacibaculum sp. Bg11-29]
MIRNIFYLANVVIFLFVSCAQENKIKETKLEGLVFGTTYHITYLNEVDYQGSIDSLFALVNKSLSTYIATSDISRINKGDSTVVVDGMFIDVFEKAKRIYNETDGYFDPTIGRLINAYGFGSGKEKKNLSSEEVAELMDGVGFDKVKLENSKVYRESSNIEFNVNAFAKGYGIDVIGWFLESKNVKNYLIEIGGEIRARGRKEGGLWKVAIEKPNVDGTRSLQKVIELDGESMATSGNYRKYKMNKNGEKIVHTVNPKTGLAFESNLLSVSVRLKGDCADVDAYATAFLAMGLDKTKDFLVKHPELKVVLLYNDNDNNLQEFVN